MSEPLQPQQRPPGQPPFQPPPQLQQPVPPPAPAKRKRFGWLALLVTAVVALLLGLGLGASGDAGTQTAEPQPTVTVTETAPPVVEGGSEPTDEATDEPSEEPTKAAWNPKPKDFKIGIKILTKECFGSAGCNITYRIKPEYVGSQAFPDSGTTEVTYEVTGGEDTITNTFEIDSAGTAHFDKEEIASTEASSDKLSAKATEVSYN